MQPKEGKSQAGKGKPRPDLSFVMSYLWPDPNSKGNAGLAQKLLNEWGFEAVKFAIERANLVFPPGLTVEPLRFRARIGLLQGILEQNWYITEAELQSGQYPAKIRERELDKKLASQS